MNNCSTCGAVLVRSVATVVCVGGQHQDGNGNPVGKIVVGNAHVQIVSGDDDGPE